MDSTNRLSPRTIAVLAFSSLSFFFLLCAFLPFLVPYKITACVIDFIWGAGTARDAQGGAFGTLYLIGGSQIAAWICYWCGMGFVDDIPNDLVKKTRYNNLVAILATFVFILLLLMVLAAING